MVLKEGSLGIRGKEALFIAENISKLSGPSYSSQEPISHNPLRMTQCRIIKNSLGERESLAAYLSERIKDPFAQGLTRGQLLAEYTSILLAREFALEERLLHRSGKLDFYVHSSGIELPQIAVQRCLTNDDAYLPYYRAQAADIYRGGTPEELFAMDLHRQGDTHSFSRQLGGHVASDWRSEIPVISITGAHVLTAVGIGTALNDRRLNPQERYKRFNKQNAIAVTEIGEATFAQGEVMEAVSQAVKDSSAVVMVGYNNLAGISMGLGDTSVGHDPILFARGFQDQGLFIVEVDGRNPQEVVEGAKKVVDYTRIQQKPSLIMVNNLFRVTDHTSSSMQAWYTPPDELERRRQFDFLPSYTRLLENIGVATHEEIEAIQQNVRLRIKSASGKVMARPFEDPQNLYYQVYSPEFHYGSLRISNDEVVPPLDHLQSTRTSGVDYTDKARVGPEISGRQYISLVLAQEMIRDPNIVVFGEDVAMATKDDWNILPDYFDQRVRQKNIPWEDAHRAQEALDYVLRGEGYKADPDVFALFADIMEGKGGVFKNTQYLDWLFGSNRAFNFPIREASIVGTAIGRAIAGQLPVVEIQFDVYTSPVFQQIHDYLSTLRWRGKGQFSAGMVIRIQGMNRVGGDGINKAGGVGGIGHGAADVSRFLIPGLRHFIPADVEDLGCGLREAIRVAREYGDPVLIWEPINTYNTKGIYQGHDAHIPLGEAELVRYGKDALIITWSNNMRIAKAVAEQLERENIQVGVLNARALGDQFDWKTAVPLIKDINKVIVFEAGRKDGGTLAAQIGQQLFGYLDAPVVWLSAKNIPMPAGEKNEEFVVPQYKNLLDTTRNLVRY